MLINKEKNQYTTDNIYRVSVTKEDELCMVEPIRQRIVELVAYQIAQDILQNNYAEIIGKISPEAIANMAIAEAGAAINETLNKKLPDKIIEIHKTDTQVYQRGLLGGLNRIV